MNVYKYFDCCVYFINKNLTISLGKCVFLFCLIRNIIILLFLYRKYNIIKNNTKNPKKIKNSKRS